MREALALAERGLGWVAPNPPVGCVLVRDGQVIGRGWHAQLGGLHAETAALAAAGDARGATCYVTLEPCSHVGRQPACTDALIRAGVARVVYGALDPDRRTCGKARGILEAQGIAVSEGVLQSACERFLDAYMHYQSTGRPFVQLKLALSLDARLACANGQSQWLSGPESHGYAHYLRQVGDGILVGRGTVLADDPQLSVRPEVLAGFGEFGFAPRDPVRIVLDPDFSLLPQLTGLKLAQPGGFREGLPQLVLLGRIGALPANWSDQLVGLTLDVRAIEIETLPDSHLDLHAAITQLGGLGLTSILVEGGAGVARSFLAQGVADKLTLVYTPALLGSDALDFSPTLGLTSVQAAPRLQDVETRALGSDVLVSGYLRH
jgi:diaminohydroxyphosphoribosylaminopyrimidine deaminase / 5-amino-6-(5-phosphoribosylamino)uracil reductase